jgi:DNA-binding response OmpR family regulator
MKSYILLVEDDHAVREFLVDLLSDAGYQVIGVQSLVEAHATLSARRPSLVLLNQRLPDGEGTSLLPALHPDPPPVVVLSGQAAPAALPAEVVQWLQKPFDIQDLLAAVATYYTP